uniref:SFRICE_031248 n=1 Tax=Spodoptera frugiperda TaxID=7108 RepID=A0A2H1WY63_SPOFR
METTQSSEQPPPAKNPAVKKKPFLRKRPDLPSREIPKPKYLSTTSTPLTNDPLWQQSFVNEEERGLSSVEGIKIFNADAAGYVALVEREYIALGDCDKYVVKEVPQSAYAYFHHV